MAALATDVSRDLQRVRLHLARSPSAPGEARDAIGGACDRWGLGDLRCRAMLIVSELVTNAIRHAGTDVEIDAALRDHYLQLRVMDANPAPPVMVAAADASALAESGRGLPVVAHYSDAWGYTVNSLGTEKVVWATLRTHPSGG
jgi:anti-sigma regulatory factor (Ser/Thr protein kinase)